MRITSVLSMLVAGTAVAGCATDSDEAVPPDLPTMDDVVMGNLACAEAAARVGHDLGDFELRVEPGTPGTYALDEVNDVTFVSADQLYLDWSATLGVDAVLVHGGGQTMVYAYAGEARAGTGLSAAWNGKLGEPYPITGVDFCYDHELAIATRADTALTRSVSWTIDLEPARTELTLDRGAEHRMPFKAKVERAGWKDGDWKARAEIVVENPSPYPARVLGIEARIGDVAAAVVCPESFRFELAPFSAITCAYERALPDGNPRTSHVVAKTAGYEVGMGTASALVDFTDAAVTVRDARVEVRDQRRGLLGTTTEDRTFHVWPTIGPYTTCDATELFEDTATVTGTDSGQVVARDTAAVLVHVICCD